MRQARIKGEGVSFYHCVSRVVDRQFIFGNEEREFFVALMRKLEAFHGLRVLTYVVMSNHFHLLLEEPDREAMPLLDRESLLKRLGFLYKRMYVDTVRQELERAAKAGNEAWEKAIIERYQSRMGDVSTFMKELKQRFSSWYNRRKGRKGTLWEERFKSMLVEGDEKALMTIAAYIDLNPVRAGMVSRVEDYRWCGYASATAGNRWARQGLGRILSSSARVSGGDFEKHWKETAALYRLWLYDQGEERELADSDTEERTPKSVRCGFSAEEVETEIQRGGKIPLKQLIRLRVRSFIDGGVLGSATFVDRAIERYREEFKIKRKTGPRQIRNVESEGLCVFRDLKRA